MGGDSDDRLTRAFAAASPAARDPAFVLAVLERAEASRFRRATLRSLMRGAAMATGGAALLTLFADWAAVHVDALMQGAVSAAALLTLLGAARAAASRLDALR